LRHSWFRKFTLYGVSFVVIIAITTLAAFAYSFGFHERWLGWTAAIIAFVLASLSWTRVEGAILSRLAFDSLNEETSPTPAANKRVFVVSFGSVTNASISHAYVARVASASAADVAADATGQVSQTPTWNEAISRAHIEYCGIS